MYAFADHLRGAVRELCDLLSESTPPRPVPAPRGFWRRLFGR